MEDGALLWSEESSLLDMSSPFHPVAMESSSI